MIYNFVQKMLADYLFQKIYVLTLELHSILIYFLHFPIIYILKKCNLLLILSYT